MGRKENPGNVPVVDALYNKVPAFTDIFDEQTFYTFVICFVLTSIILVVIASRFIKLRPVDW